MKKITAIFLLLGALSSFAQQPKLVVGIVIDQMRAEYLYRFQDEYSAGGFKRLMKKGFVYKNMHFNYAPTYTAPGHTSIYTGTTPAHHGIIANDWYDRDSKQLIYCTEDHEYKTLGEESEQGEMSPKKMITSTVTDELKLYTNQQAKVFGVSVKDRGAIFPAGHFADAAYWLSDQGNFISSTYYMQTLPNWVTQFNGQKKAKDYLTEWRPLLDLAEYDESGEDDSVYEAAINGQQPVFPYLLNDSEEKTIKLTPFGNQILWDFTKELIQKEKLGQNTTTDFLTISFSSTDYIGHYYGIHAKEIQDTYVRLDRILADLLSFLDSEIGKNDYLLFLTADHGASENSYYLKDLRYPIEPITDEIINKQLEKLRESLTERFGVDPMAYYFNENIYLDHHLLEQHHISLEDVSQMIIEEVEKYDVVKKAYSAQDLLQSNEKLSGYHESIAQGILKYRSGDVVLLFQPGQYLSYHGITGATHGSPYNYDTHVPCILFGKGIAKGTNYDKKWITQLTPTISALLDIPYANAANTQLLTEVLDK